MVAPRRSTRLAGKTASQAKPGKHKLELVKCSATDINSSSGKIKLASAQIKSSFAKLKSSSAEIKSSSAEIKPLSARVSKKNAPGSTVTLARFEISVPVGFDLELAVCSYGFFCLAPNRWVPKGTPEGGSSGALIRPLRLASGRAVLVQIGQAETLVKLEIEVKGVQEMTREDKAAVEVQVKRMLRLSAAGTAAVQGFQQLHAEAKAAHFGRLFRSPSLWEDLVKSQLLCNCGWGRTVDMNKALCRLQAELKGPPLGTPADHATPPQGGGDFPTAAELQDFDPADLAARCGLGYRAARIVKLAKGVCSGAIDLGVLESGALGGVDEVRRAVLAMPGFGPFAGANVMQCLGEYELVAADSETARHLREVHGRADCTLANVDKVAAEVYAPYKPYQFLAYWWELWGTYEKKFGKFSSMTAEDYRRVTGHNMRKPAEREPLTPVKKQKKSKA